MIQFPHNFFWGAATSAYQVEGGNINSDWWEWEKRVGLKETSGAACRHYELFQEDFNLAKELNHNAHRFSIEWSRIEPQEGKFSQSQLGHYIEVVASLRKRNLEPIVTLHHFTNPLWFSRLGGWQNRRAGKYFLRYVNTVVEALSDKVTYWVTFNEPMVYVYHSYILGAWPPQEKSFLKAKKVQDNIARAHMETYRLIREIYKKKNLASAQISIAQNLQVFLPCSANLRNKCAAFFRDKFFNFALIEQFIRYKSLDFIGINYYTRSLVEVERWRFRNLALDICEKNHSELKKNSLGWDICPEGLYHLLLRLKKYNLPVFILENGICIDDDKLRWDFIYQHLKNIYRATQDGVRVLGYLYWSLLDNFEWDKGFRPRFGLVDVDYTTYKRTVRESAKKFSLVCKNGTLD